VFLSEFRLFIQRNGVKVFEELVHVVGTREVELAFLEGAYEVAGITLSNRRRRYRDEGSSTPRR